MYKKEWGREKAKEEREPLMVHSTPGTASSFEIPVNVERKYLHFGMKVYFPQMLAIGHIK